MEVVDAEGRLEKKKQIMRRSGSQEVKQSLSSEKKLDEELN